MRIRLCFARHLSLVLILSLNAFALEVGDEWQEPPAELGRPLGRIVTGDKTLYRWPDLEVTVAAGRVTQIRRLDAASVAAESEQRGKQNATERARLLAERKERARKDAERIERERAEQLARDQAAAEEAGRQAEAKRQRAEQVLAAEEAERAAALRAEEAKAGREKRERMANADKERAETARHLKALAREESEARAKREAEVAASAAAAKAAMERQAAASAPESSSSGFALVKSPTDPVARLAREIEIFEQDLRRAELGTEPRDRAEAARLRLLLRDKRAQLDAARAKR